MVPEPCPVFNPSARLPLNQPVVFFIKCIACRAKILLTRLESTGTQKHLSSVIINFRNKLKFVLGKDYFRVVTNPQQCSKLIGLSTSPPFPQELTFPQLNLKRRHDSVNHMLAYVLSSIDHILFSCYSEQRIM